MRILFLNDAPIIKYGIAAGLKELGYPVEVIGLWKHKTSEAQEAILRQTIESFCPDALFVEGHPGINRSTLFKVVKELNQNLIYWAIEDPPHHNWISVPYAEQSRYVFTTAEECIEKYRALGVESDLLLFACNPTLHKKVVPDPHLTHEIVFVGSNYDIRYDAVRRILKPLLDDEDLDLFVWGLWWDDPKRPINVPPEKYGGLLPYEKLASVYSSAKIVLGMHCDASSKTQTSMRTFEVLGCGAFYLTQYTPAHDNLFINKKHLVWSSRADETVRLVRYYLNNIHELEKVAQAGQTEVYKKHTYHHRAVQLAKTLKNIL